jgi:hypothetical protein
VHLLVYVGALFWVDLLAPERETFRARTLAEALGWCLVWVMGTTGEIGVNGFVS